MNRTLSKTRKLDSLKNSINRFIPSYAILPLLTLVVSNIFVYYGARLLNDLLGRPYIDMTSVFDSRITVIPAFAVIYVIAFPFWYITYFLICRTTPEKCRATVIVNVGIKILCGIIFVLLPTTNVRPVLGGKTAPEKLLGFIYSFDAPDNLFPSIHCFESWLCFLLLRDEPKVPEGVKFTSMILAIAICLSTLFTKQHVIADVVAGVILAGIAYSLRCRLLNRRYAFLRF